MQNTLLVKNLNCERGEQSLFVGLNFELKQGEILQVRGANGAGKTSLLRMLAGLAFINEGEIFWNQQSIQSLKQMYYSQVNYIGHKLGFKEDLTAEENLQFETRQNGQGSKSSINTALEQLSIGNKKNSLVKNLSAGQKRRAVLAKLMVKPATLWILDEPFTAIDQIGVEFLVDLMHKQQQKGGMIIFTSHQDIVLKSDKQELIL